MVSKFSRRLLWASCLAVFVAAAQQVVDAQQKPYEPQVGQPGKDTVWVPTPDVLVEKMLDMAEVTPKDFVIDLGSGDGRNVIAAAKRGARGLGVEYNPDMVVFSKKRAAEAGVSDMAQFVEGDMFAADISKATVLALFLLPDNMRRLREKFLDLTPGTRIVANTFGIEDWTPDDTQEINSEQCTSWCTALLFIVPAKVAGTWKLPQGELTLRQAYQNVSGSLVAGGSNSTVERGRLRGAQISFSAGGADYTGRVTGNTMQGTFKSAGRQGNWTATRTQ
jgi:SAM-dependent methyltransferase